MHINSPSAEQLHTSFFLVLFNQPLMWQQWNAGKHKNREEMHTLGIWLETWEKWKTGSNSDHHAVRLRTEKYLRIHITSSLEADWLQYHKTTSCSASFSQEQKSEAVSGTGSPTLDSWRLEKCSQFLLRHRGSMFIIQAPLIQINHWLSVVAFLLALLYGHNISNI